MRIITLPTPLTTLTGVRLHEREDRTDDVDAIAPVYDSGQWLIATGTRRGRYYPVFEGTVSGVAYEVMTDYADLPQRDDLVVSPEVVAVEAAMTLPLSSTVRAVATQAIRNAQSDVVAHLGRPITPITYVQPGVWPISDDWRPSLTAHGDDNILRIVSAVPEMTGGVPTGYFTVTYLAGLDGAMDPALDPIRRYVLAHAMNSPRFVETWRVETKQEGFLKTSSAEGQSVSYEKPTLSGTSAVAKVGSGDPGSLPSIASLDLWRVSGRRVHQGPTRAAPWPYSSMGTTL